MNYRPEYKPEWGQKTYYTQVRLTPLGQAEVAEFLTFLLGNNASLNALKELVLARTDGTPFFMEEVVQTLVEEGALQGEQGNYRLETTLPELQIPPTVQGVLAARIDRLTIEEKALLQQLSVIGRQFPVSVVKQVVSQPEAELYRVLLSLQAKEYLYEQPAFPESEYIFKHALTQDVAYGTVLQEQRKALHGRTADALEALYAAKLEDHYSDLAHHYSQSRNTKKAVEYLYLAGQQAIQRSANTEAITHLTAALSFLQTLPEGRERAEQELRLQLALGPAVMTTKGSAAPELEQAYTRALDLCHQLGDSASLSPALWGLWLSYETRGKLLQSRDLGEQMVQSADDAQSPPLQIEAHFALGQSLVVLGDFLEGRTHFETAMRLYDPQQHASLGLNGGQDPGIVNRLLLSYSLWALGYPAQAQQAINKALSLAQEGTHVYSFAFALTVAAGHYMHCQDYPLALDHADTALTLSAKHGIAWWIAVANIFRGWVLAVQGQPTEGIVLIHQGLEAYRAIEGIVWWPYYLALLADAYGKAGQAAKGLRTVADAFEVVNTTSEHWYTAELYRLKGELTLQHSQDAAGSGRLAFISPSTSPKNKQLNPGNSAQPRV